MIQNDQELKGSYETIAKMNRLRDQCAVEPFWDEDMRAVVVEGIEIQLHKIEREIAEYLASRPEKVA